MVKPVKIHDNNLWDKFVKDCENYFAVLSPGTKIAFFVGETDKNFLLIERKCDYEESYDIFAIYQFAVVYFWL